MTEEIREALKKDFRKLYVKEFTTNWETVRLIREVEIDVMSLDNLYALLSKPQQPEQVCPRCDGKEKVDTGMPLGIVTCPVCHGTGKADLDREKLEKHIARRLFYFVVSHISPQNLIGWEWTRVESYCLHEANQILAIINPDEIKRQERERIISRIEPYQIKLERKDVVPMVYFRLTKEDWQSLEEE